MASAPNIDWPALAPRIAGLLLGEPNKALSSRSELRFGSHGSVAIDLEKGTFYDHEAKAGGGMVDLIQRQRGGEASDAVQWLEDQGLKEAAEVWQLGRNRPPVAAAPKAPTPGAEYVYSDADGKPVYRVTRKLVGGEKTFVQASADGVGGWRTGKGCMEGVARLPYRLPEIAKADPGRTIFIVEGEKDADRLAEAGLLASCNSGGAGKFGPELAPHFAGRSIVVIPDNDEAGRSHARQVVATLNGVASRIGFLELEGLPDKGDVSDWLDQGGTVEDLKTLARGALERPLPDFEAMATAAEPDTSGLPTIRVRAGALAAMATEAEAALVAGGAPFFIRGGIVKPIIDDVPASHGRRTKVARLAAVDGNTLLDHLSRLSRWERYDGRSKAWVQTDPLRDVAAIISSRDGEWTFPRLAGVITTPTLRPDGTLLTEPGYDAATQLLLLDPPAMPEMPERPDKDRASRALAYLDSLLDEFPFVDDASRSVALSALITPVVRGSLPVAPMHAIHAPVPGSGKSYVIDLASAIDTGQRAPVIAAGRTEEETEKRLGAAMLEGLPIITIDNVNGQLGGDALCQLIERPIVSVRVLGLSKLVKIESRATVFATGNNIHLVGDMTRRTLLCSLDPNMERPELREFKGNPFDRVLAERGNFVAAALTVVRAYIVAGCPDQRPALASFEAWSRHVRSALVWLGRADPCETMDRARADDPVISGLSATLRAWYDAADGRAFTTGAIRALVEQKNPFGNPIHGDLLQALSEVADDGRGGISAVRLGRYLARHHGRIVEGLKFVVGEDGHAKQKVWRAVRA